MARTVVIAEDEAIVRLDLREILSEEGFEIVGETGRGDEAIDLVKTLTPDLVILDIKMPGLDGLAVARAVSEDRTDAVLILTAFSQRDLIEQARDAGALAYLVKPFQKSELLPAIEVALGRFAEIQALEAENEALSNDKRNLADQLESRRWIDRAKGKLMDDHHLSESEAFAFIQKNAMGRRVRIRDVAEEIVDGRLAP